MSSSTWVNVDPGEPMKGRGSIKKDYPQQLVPPRQLVHLAQMTNDESATLSTFHIPSHLNNGEEGQLTKCSAATPIIGHRPPSATRPTAWYNTRPSLSLPPSTGILPAGTPPFQTVTSSIQSRRKGRMQ